MDSAPLDAKRARNLRIQGACDGIEPKPDAADFLAGAERETGYALRESEQRLSAELEATRQLQAISTQLIGEQGAEALYEKIVDAAVCIMRSEFASMQMLYPERGKGGELRLLAFRGFNPQAAKFWEWVRADSESTCGAALRTGKRVVAADVTQCDFMAGSDDLQTYLQTGIHAVQTTPLFSRSGRLLGMISTHWRKPHNPTDSELQRLDVLARQAADLIERSQAEEALRRSVAETDRQRRLYEGVLKTTPDLAYIFDLDHRFIYANEGLLRMWGKSWDEAIGKNCLELGYEPWHAAMHDREIEQVVATKQPIRGEVPFAGAFGRRIYDYIFTPVLNEQGEVEAVAGTTRDVTERKEQEEALRASEQQFRALASASSDVVYNMSADWSEMRHLEGRDFIADTHEPSRAWIGKYIHPDDQPHVMAAIEEAIRTKSVFELEHRVLRVDGSLGWTFSRAVPLLDNKGGIVEWIGMASDITERKRAEEAKARLAAIVESTDDAVVSKDLNGIIKTWNRGAEHLFGYTAQEAVGQSITMVIPAERLDEEPAILERIRRGERIDHYETVRQRKDGSLIDVSLTISPIKDAEGRITGASKIARDITERKRAEESLRTSEADLRLRNEELARFNRAAVGREMRMVELKKEINDLCDRLGEPARYPLAFEREERDPRG